MKRKTTLLIILILPLAAMKADNFTYIGVNSPTTSTGNNTAEFRAPNIGSNNSHVHWGAKGDWYIRSAASDGKVIIQDSGGNVGIGTSNPSRKLQVYGNLSTYNELAAFHSPNAWMAFSDYGIRFDSNITASNSQLYLEDQDNSNNRFIIESWGGNKSVPAFFVTSSGKVGIGDSTPENKLDVDGTIRAKEVIVESDWSDFVFEDSYRLRSLDEVESHIEEHGHLPDVPSAAVVESEGLSVGEAQKIMMQKIEELTLYMIEKDKEVATLRKQLQAQQKRIQELETN